MILDTRPQRGRAMSQPNKGLQAESNPTPFQPFPERGRGRPTASDAPPLDRAAGVRAMCDILCDPVVPDDDKYMALTTLGDMLFPDRPIFRDMTNASDWPPSPEDVDGVLGTFRGAADAAGHQGSSEEPFLTAIACIEWALGRQPTVSVPCYVAGIIEQVTGVKPGEE